MYTRQFESKPGLRNYDSFITFTYDYHLFVFFFVPSLVKSLICQTLHQLIHLCFPRNTVKSPDLKNQERETESGSRKTIDVSVQTFISAAARVVSVVHTTMLLRLYQSCRLWTSLESRFSEKSLEE